MLCSLSLALALTSPAAAPGGHDVPLDLNSTGSSFPDPVARVGDLAFLRGNTATANRVLHVTDGTLGGTFDLSAALPPSLPPNRVDGLGFQGRLVTTWGGTLAESDGTLAGTGYLIAPGAAGAPSGARSLVEVSDRLLFLGEDAAAGGLDLWISDGTAAGTALLFDLPGASPSGNPELVSAGGFAYLSLPAVGGGRRHYVTDATAAGTVELQGPVAHPQTSGAIAFGDEVWFLAGAGLDNEVWRTDGTLGGARRVTAVGDKGLKSGLTPVRNGALDGVLFKDTTLDGTEPSRLYYASAASAALFSLPGGADVVLLPNETLDGPPAAVYAWRFLGDVVRIDDLSGPQDVGTGPGIQSLTSFFHVPGSEVVVFPFRAQSTLDRKLLWRSDGTPAGTWPVPGIAEPEQINGTSYAPTLFLGERWIYTLEDPVGGVEPHAISTLALDTGSIEVLPGGCEGASSLDAFGGTGLGELLVLQGAGAQPAQPGVLGFGRELAPLPAVHVCDVGIALPRFLAAVLADGSGSFRFDLTVPAVPALIGQDYAFQALMARSGGPLAGLLEATNPVEVTVGG